jgi:hypothetical protein
VEKEFAAAFDRNYKRLRMDADTSSLEERSLTNIASLLAPFDVLSKRIDMPFSMDGKEGLYSVLKDIAVEQQKQISGTNEVNQFWEIFDKLAVDGQLTEGYDYQRKDGFLWIYFPSVYDKYNDLAVRQNLNRLDKATLKSYLTIGNPFASEQCDSGRHDKRLSTKKRQKRFMPFIETESPINDLDFLQPKIETDEEQNKNEEK